MLRFWKYGLNAVFAVAYSARNEKEERDGIHTCFNQKETQLASIVCADQFFHSWSIPRNTSASVLRLVGSSSVVLIEKFKRVLSKKGVLGTEDGS
jgi:hypothetical protein